MSFDMLKRAVEYCVPPRATAFQSTLVAQQPDAQAVQTMHAVKAGFLSKDAVTLKQAAELRSYRDFIHDEILIHTPLGV